jgi:hypothetical protein
MEGWGGKVRGSGKIGNKKSAKKCEILQKNAKK